ncbi:coproporphyrinogen III oxidase [Xanthomonadaceae bacterium XH05]|nr:coproporphyrinogen III oxidase [Xanthomonadaceae bacterium XH05]
MPFSTRFQEKDLRLVAATSNGDPIPRPLSLHVRFPRRAELPGPPAPRARSAAYLTRLYREIALVAALFDRDRQVEQVYFLGSTLGFLDPPQVVEVMDVLGRHFSFSQGGRTARGIQLDPASDIDDDIAQLPEAGFDRAMLICEDRARIGAAIARLPALVHSCRRFGLKQVQVDLCCDLPERSEAELAQALEAILLARPDRVRIVGCSRLEPGVNEDACIERLRCALDRLQQAGYSHLGMYCFVLPGDELLRARRCGELHCDPMGYTAHAESDVVGVGLGAVSHIGASISHGLRDLSGWEESIDRGRLPIRGGIQLDEDRQLCAEVVQQLLCRGGIDFREISRAHGVDFRKRFAEALERLEPLATRRLVELTPERIHVTMRGRLALPALVACFDGKPAVAAGLRQLSVYAP